MVELTVNEIAPIPSDAPEFRGGIIRVNSYVLDRFGVNIRACNTQGELEDTGVFAAVHAFLHLPKNYTIRMLLLRYLYMNEWEIVVECPELPVVVLGCEPPILTPIYQHDEAGLLRLIKIKIENGWERTFLPDELTIERIGTY